MSCVPSVQSVKCDSAIPVLDNIHNAMLSTLLCIREEGEGVILNREAVHFLLVHYYFLTFFYIQLLVTVYESHNPILKKKTSIFIGFFWSIPGIGQKWKIVVTIVFCKLKIYFLEFINRPDVAGAVLQTPLLLIYKFSR